MFELSPHIDKNKIFLVNLSEIEGRLDPVMLLYQRKINNYRFNLVPVKDLLLSNPQYGANEAGIDRLNNNEPRYIRITDIDEYGNLINELGKTANKIEQQYILENDDIIIARSGNTVGKSYIHKSNKVTYPCFFAGYMIRFKFNSEIIYPDYAFIVTQLNFYKEWLNAVRRLAGQPNINAEEYKNFKVPFPPKETQQKIIDLYETAYNEKQQKEAEAEHLLNSIDIYLLGELGITLPEKDNSLENRMFKVNFSEVTGGRFDPDYYQTYYQNFITSINNGIFKLVQLKEVLSFIGSGKTPAASDYSETPTQYPIIKAGSYTDEYINLNKADYTTIKPFVYTKQGDIFILSAAHQSEYVGKQIKYLADNPEQKTSFVGELICLRANTELINSIYLFSLLNLNVYKTLLNREKTGQTSHIYSKDIKKISIPIPPIEKQNEIAEHIKAIREKAKQLKAEAKEVLEQAKQEAEKIILGEKMKVVKLNKDETDKFLEKEKKSKDFIEKHLAKLKKSGVVEKTFDRIKKEDKE